MNKRKVAACLLLTMSVGLFGGCGKKEEPPITEEVIQVSFNTEVKPPNQMSKAELMALTPKAIKEMVETYLPNYRAIYSISENYAMADDDWVTLRDLICDQLYGIEKPADEQVADAGEDESVIPANIDWKQPDKILGDDGSFLDPEWIFYAPCKEYVEQLDDEQFIDYLELLMSYWKKDDIKREDFENMDEEGLAKVRDMVYTDFCVPWGSVAIPTVKQLKEGTVAGSDETEEAGVYNEDIQKGLQAALDRYKKDLKKEDLVPADQELSAEEDKLLEDFLVSFVNYEVTESDVKSFTKDLELTEKSTYEEFLVLSKEKLIADGWTTTGEDGKEKAIETDEEAEEYMCSLIAINVLMTAEAAGPSDIEATE